ncbi:hypothetical protein FRB90_004788 [Tulasnella sp. 427]|nr:hypothetical protein FRB90_004788 [Tulasnella sp. 427]
MATTVVTPPRNPRRATSSLMLKPGDDPAKPYVDRFAPALDKLESARPGLPTLPESGLTLDAARVELVPHLDKWVEWAEELEEFVWDFGQQLLGEELWMPTTDAVQDLKREIRSVSEAITCKNTSYLQSQNLLSPSSPSSSAPTLCTESMNKLLDSEQICFLMDWARVRTNEVKDVTAIVPLAIPFTESPEPMSAFRLTAGNTPWPVK